MTKLLLKGRVAAVLPENTDTDVIYPGRYLNITDRDKRPSICSNWPTRTCARASSRATSW